MQKRFKMISILVVSTLVSLSLIGCGASTENKDEAKAGDQADAGNKVRTLRISMGVNDKHPEYEGAMKFKEIVESKSDDFEVQVFPSGQIGDDRATTEMLQMGTLEITIPSTSPVANFVPQFGVFDLPFTIPNEEVADKVLDGPFGQKMLDLLPAQQLVGLAWWENGFRNLTNSKVAVQSVNDLNGLKIRTMQNQIHLDAWKALGANPTPMSFSELFTAMQQGTVDGQENPYPTILLSKFYEVQKYLTATNHVYTPFIFLFSKKIWDELTPEQQKLLKDAAVEAGKYNRQRNREVAGQALEELKQKMTFTELSPEVRAQFEDKVKPIIDKHKNTIGAEIVDDYLKAIEEAR